MTKGSSHCEECNDEAISKSWGEIATLPLVARKDNVTVFNIFVLITPRLVLPQSRIPNPEPLLFSV